jgi:hypothetical protein
MSERQKTAKPQRINYKAWLDKTLEALRVENRRLVEENNKLRNENSELLGEAILNLRACLGRSNSWQDVLRVWWRALVKQHHPDRGGDGKVMAALTDAKDRLVEILESSNNTAQIT